MTEERVTQGTEVAPAEKGGEVVGSEEQAIIDNIRSKFGSNDFVLPILKLTQALSKEVQNGDAKPGELVNSLTGENYGDEVELVVCEFFKGRFYATEDGKVYVAQSEVIPDSWDHADSGKRFDESLDAEEQWKARSNSGEIAWGKGPPIATTFNYVAFIPGEDAPLRVSLMKSETPAARKLNTQISMAQAPWDYVFRVAVKGEVNSRQQAYHVREITRGRKTTPEERQSAVQLATQFAEAAARSGVALVGEEDSTEKKRTRKAGAPVS